MNTSVLQWTYVNTIKNEVRHCVIEKSVHRAIF